MRYIFYTSSWTRITAVIANTYLEAAKLVKAEIGYVPLNYKVEEA